MRSEIVSQIKNIINVLVQNGICVYQNFPVLKDHNIIWADFKDLSFSLKNEPYDVIYDECLKAKDFNILMLDGAIIQFMYKFYREEILEHKLAFYPNPNLERFQDNPNQYEDVYYGQNFFSDMYDKKIVCTPIRFDYNNSDSIHKDVLHPKSHLTIGNYPDCRIPIKAPLTPYRFISFILKSFYFEKFVNLFNNNTFDCNQNLGEMITANEKKHLHLAW